MHCFHKTDTEKTTINKNRNKQKTNKQRKNEKRKTKKKKKTEDLTKISERNERFISSSFSAFTDKYVKS